MRFSKTISCLNGLIIQLGLRIAHFSWSLFKFLLSRPPFPLLWYFIFEKEHHWYTHFLSIKFCLFFLSGKLRICFPWILPLSLAPIAHERRHNLERETAQKMTSAIVRPTFIFRLHQTKKPQTTSIVPQWGISKRPISHKSLLITSSVDLSQEDKPLEAETTTPEAALEEATEIPEQDQPNLDPRRFEEKFAVINTGVYECRSCG